MDGVFREDSSNSSSESGTLLTTDRDTHAAAVDGPTEAQTPPNDAQTAGQDAIGIAGIDVGITPRDAAGAAKEKRRKKHNAL